MTIRGKRIYFNGRMEEASRAVVEQHLSRKLLRGHHEVVHHKDKNITNNSIENLEVLTSKEHAKRHPKNSLLYRKKFPGINQSWCSRCKKFLERSEFPLERRRWNLCYGICRNCLKMMYLRKKALRGECA